MKIVYMLDGNNSFKFRCFLGRLLSMKDWDAQLDSVRINALTYLIWAASCVCFIGGFIAGFDFESIEVETFVGTCIAFTQTYGLRNYRKLNSVRNAAIIWAVALWAVGFAGSRFGMIQSQIYAGVVGTFVLLVILIRSRR